MNEQLREVLIMILVDIRDELNGDICELSDDAVDPDSASSSSFSGRSDSVPSGSKPTPDRVDALAAVTPEYSGEAERRPTAASVWREFAAVAARSSDRRAALTEMARMIANRLDVDVCSIYVLDDRSGEFVLAATMGLNQEAVGQVCMNPAQGLVGLVARELQPKFIADAQNHPRFEYFPEAGEEPFVSFFGVPILHGGELRGVLVIQSGEARDLTTEWASVATAAQRIAPFVEPGLLELGRP